MTAGLELARQGGAQAVTLRAVTRAAGVSPAAAYRHFADLDELLSAVGARALRALALAIEDEQAAATRAVEGGRATLADRDPGRWTPPPTAEERDLAARPDERESATPPTAEERDLAARPDERESATPPTAEERDLAADDAQGTHPSGPEPTVAAPAELAIARLRAVGQAYIGFALEHTRVFELAMFGLPTMADAHRPDAAGRTGRTAYELLTDAVTDLVTAGVLPPEQADGVIVLCWSTVHGFAALATQGPLRELPSETLAAAGAAVIQGVTAALGTPVGA